MHPRAISTQVFGHIGFGPSYHFLNVLPALDRIVITVALGFFGLFLDVGHDFKSLVRKATRSRRRLASGSDIWQVSMS